MSIIIPPSSPWDAPDPRWKLFPLRAAEALHVGDCCRVDRATLLVYRWMAGPTLPDGIVRTYTTEGAPVTLYTSLVVQT